MKFRGKDATEFLEKICVVDAEGLKDDTGDSINLSLESYTLMFNDSINLSLESYTLMFNDSINLSRESPNTCLLYTSDAADE